MRFVSFYSGSSGNCLYVGSGDTHVLIDAGLSGKKIEAALREHALEPEKLSGILITHEHRDHISGAGILSRRFNLPIWANEATWSVMEKDLGKVSSANKRLFDSEKTCVIGDLEVCTFPLSHDAANPVGMSFTDGCKNVVIATDTGVPTSDMMAHLSRGDLIFLESNHDLDMLQTGAYPYPLKRRIAGDLGHLSNKAAAQIVCDIVSRGRVSHVILGHLSGENNVPDLADMTTRNALRAMGVDPEKDIVFEVAKRHESSQMHTL